MKKLSSLLLAVLLLALSASSAFAVELTNEASGITITIPSGFSYQDTSTAEVTSLVITDDNEPNLAYVYEVAYFDDLADTWLEDLSEDGVQALATSVAQNVGDLYFDTVEQDGIFYLVLQNEEGTFGGIIYLLGGWVCALYSVVGNDHVMTDLVWEDIDVLQASITFAG